MFTFVRLKILPVTNATTATIIMVARRDASIVDINDKYINSNFQVKYARNDYSDNNLLRKLFFQLAQLTGQSCAYEQFVQ